MIQEGTLVLPSDDINRPVTDALAVVDLDGPVTEGVVAPSVRAVSERSPGTVPPLVPLPEGGGTDTTPAPSLHQQHPDGAAGSIERLSSMYRDVAAAQLAMVAELSKLSTSIARERALAGHSSQQQPSQPERQPSQPARNGRAPLTRGNDSPPQKAGTPAPSSRRNKGSPVNSERDPARKLAFSREERNIQSTAAYRLPPAGEEAAPDETDEPVESSFRLPKWARPSLNA